MRNLHVSILLSILPLTSFGQTTLTVENYLTQVQQSSPGLQGSLLMEEAAQELENEGSHFYAPNLFANYSHTHDERPTVIPAFQGNKTVQDNFSVGVNQESSFGLKSSVYFNSNTSTIYGVDPLFYPLPHLNVQSMNLELRQSLLRNGFGRTTRALVKNRNARNLSMLYQQKFMKKTELAEAETRYWQLSTARNYVVIQQNSLDRTKQFHQINSKRARLNLIDNADLVASEAALKQRELELKNAQDQEKVAARLFNESRGSNSDQVTEILVPPSPELIEQLPSFKKAAQRDDVKAAQAEIEVLRTTAVQSKDERLPQLDAFAHLSTNGLDPRFSDSTSQAFGTDYPNITVGGQLVVPLDFAKNNKARRAYTKQIIGAEKSYQNTVLQQDTSWNSLNEQWVNAKDRLKMALDLKKTQTTKLEKERQRLSNGRSTTYQVFLFEQDLLNAELLILQTQQLALNIYAQMRTYGE